MDPDDPDADARSTPDRTDPDVGGGDAATDEGDSAAGPTEPTDRDVACFEAGVKFGALYHQFAGTPVSPGSAPSLERAIEDAIENQPFCTSVDVDVDREAVREASSRGYTELTGRFMDVAVVVEREGVAVETRMATEEGYPLMRVESVRE